MDPVHRIEGRVDPGRGRTGLPPGMRHSWDLSGPRGMSSSGHGASAAPDGAVETLHPVKRAAVRASVHVTMACRPYVSHGVAQTVDGIMRNFSRQGSYIETTREFETGTILILRMIRYAPSTPAGENESQPRTIGLAEVKWCRKLADPTTCRYGMGVRYLD